MIYKTIDLCAGIGGIRRGFELTGAFQNVLSAEIDQFAAKTYKHLFGEDPTNDLTSEEFKRKVETTEYDVLLAGFPCQTFSRVGKKQGFRDTTRGTIFFDIADIISRTSPRAVFLENVENLVSHDKGNTIETIITTLEDELDYRVIGVTLDEDGNYQYSRASLVSHSRYFGVPQNRPRAYIMAFSKKTYGNAIKLLNMQLPETGSKVIFQDVHEILDQEVDDHYYMASGYWETLKRHKERQQKKGYGFGYCVVNQSEEEHPIAYTILATGGSGRERNLIYQPKANVAGKTIIGKKTVLNAEGIRVMTPTEWGRLQGFIGYAFMKDGKENFSFPDGIPEARKYMQFGNSVTIPVIERMAEFMLECFEILEKQQAEIVKAMAKNRLFFTKRDVMERLDLDSVQAGSLLKSLVESNDLKRISSGKTTRYVRYQETVELPPYSQEEKVIQMAKENPIITNKDVREQLVITPGSANVLLSGMVAKGSLERTARGKYRIPVPEQLSLFCDNITE